MERDNYWMSDTVCSCLSVYLPCHHLSSWCFASQAIYVQFQPVGREGGRGRERDRRW